MKLGFWNIDAKNKNEDKSDFLVDFCIERSLDILVLAESSEKTNTSFLLKINNINSQSTSKFKLIYSEKEKLKVFSRYEETIFTDYSSNYKSTRWLIHNISIPSKLKINLVSVHLNSQRSWSESSLNLECVNLARDIIEIERLTNCEETIIIGDFNLNPFNDGLVAANGLNAVADLNSITKNQKGREVDGVFYKFFYNPMWNFFGNNILPLGTYYYRNSGHVSIEWHIFDQILIRPSLHEYLKYPYVEIIHSLKSGSLLTKSDRPNEIKYSDHLPILLNLTF